MYDFNLCETVRQYMYSQREKRMKVHVLQTGNVSVDIGIPLRQKSPTAFTGFFRDSSCRVSLPVFIYLIEHPEGLVLVDTGWSLKERNKKVNKVFGQIPPSVADLPEGMSVAEQLACLGYQAKDLDYVFVTHLDTDHAGGLAQVKDAKQIFVSQEEWDAANDVWNIWRYDRTLWKGTAVKTFSFEYDRKAPHHRSYDVFGDGSLVLVHTPGHSYGQCSVVVKGDSGFVVIAGDAGYCRESWEDLHLMGLTVDTHAAYQSLCWLNAMRLNRECIEVLASHDPEVQPHVITL